MMPVGMLLLAAGVVMIYSGVKGDDPRDVILDVLGKDPRYGKDAKPPPAAAEGKTGLGPSGSSGGGVGGGGGGSW